MFKKVNFFIVTLIIMLLLVIPIHLKATTNVLQISNTSFEVLRGEEFSTTIYVEEGSNVTGLIITLCYDEELVTLVDYKKLNVSEINVKNNNIIITYSGVDNIEDKLELLELTFKVDEQIAIGNYTNWLYWGKGDNDEAFTTDGFENGMPIFTDLSVQISFTPIYIRTKGDAFDNKGDGKITARDASFILQHAAHIITMDRINQYYANVYEDYDTNGNPKISARDASLLLQYAAQMDVKLNDRYEVVFYTLNENEEYVEYIKKSVKEGTALTSLPKLDEEVIWSISSEEYIEVDFSNITNNIKIYEYKELEHIHTIVIDEAIDATCITDGLTEGSHCSDCGEVIMPQTIIPALGHTEVIDSKVDATCITTGLTKGIHCSVCNEVLVSQTIIPALGHLEGETLVENNILPTCTTTGAYDNVKYCTVCSAELSRETIIVDASGHTEVIYSKVDPTCTTTGLTEGIHCSVCNEVLKAQEVIEALGHTEVVDTKVDPSCTTTGLTEGIHCSVCNEVLKAQEVMEALGHLEGETLVENTILPTCTTTGSYQNVKYCTVCSDELSRETIIVEALGHTEVVDPKVDATCTTTGLTEGTHCSVCNEVLVEQIIIEKLKHVYENNICSGCGIKRISEGLTYNLLSNDTYEVSGIGTCTDVDVIIPSSYNNKPVTKIKSYAFYYCEYITSVEIPDTIVEISSSSFYYCISLVNVKMYNNLKIIGDYAFYNCISLQSVEIPDSVISIEASAFYKCTSLTNVKLSNSLKIIESYAFAYCPNLTNIIIPNSVIAISSPIFYESDNLIIYCEVESQPAGWEEGWNSSNLPVVWGYVENK